MDMTTPALQATDPVAWATPAPVTKRRFHRLRRLLLGILGGIAGSVAVLAASGAAYEAVASAGDALAYPASGRLVDVGGYRLHIDCRGEGAPTVVMDAGLGGSSLDWVLVQAGLSSDTKVCSYDRAGMGWSDAGPLPRSPGHIAEELQKLLQAAAIPGPYVLVAHSLAGKNVRMFAAAYPKDVAGMVLVDTRSEHVDDLTSKADAEAFTAALQAQASMYSIARRFGIARLFGAGLVGLPLVTWEIGTEMALLQTQPLAIEATTAEGLARTADDAVLAKSSLGSLPLVVIAAGDSMLTTPNWSEAQQALAKLSSNGRLVVAAHSSHAVHLDQPNVVIDGVREVLASVRNGL